MKWPINLSKSPPGEWYYRQDGKSFGPSPLPKDLALTIADFRQGNSLPRADGKSCLEDLISFTVNRLPANSEFLYDTDQTPEQLTPSLAADGCAGCGAVVT